MKNMKHVMIANLVMKAIVNIKSCLQILLKEDA